MMRDTHRSEQDRRDEQPGGGQGDALAGVDDRVFERPGDERRERGQDEGPFAADQRGHAVGWAVFIPGS